MSIFPVPNGDILGGLAWATKLGDKDFVFAPHARNFLHTIVLNSCARPFWVYAVALAPAWIEAMLTVRVVDLEDLWRSGIKSAAGGRGAFGRRGGKHTGVGRVVQKASSQKRFSQGALKTFIVVTQPLELLGLGILLYAAADRFFYRWGSIIEAIHACGEDLGSLQVEWDEANWGQLEEDGPTPGGVVSQNSGGWSKTGVRFDLPPGRYYAVFGATLTPQPTTPAPFETGLMFATFGAIELDEPKSGTVQAVPGTEVDAVVSLEFIVPPFVGGGIAFATYGDTVPVGIKCVKAHATVWRSSFTGD